MEKTLMPRKQTDYLVGCEQENWLSECSKTLNLSNLGQKEIFCLRNRAVRGVC